MLQDEAWYASWFNTPYYHILYQHRDLHEAKAFMDKLFHFLNFPQDSKLLDLACGRGRHAVHMHEKGFDVTGYDLSPENIDFAKQSEENGLRFEVRDMLLPLGNQSFDGIFNLFTSFGFFETVEAHQQVICNIADALKPGGLFIIDFMNAECVSRGLVPTEVKEIDDITFKITRSIDEDCIVKTIEFEAEGKQNTYHECVLKLERQDFLKFFEECGLQLLNTFGNYKLETYRHTSSERLILIAQKAI